MTYLDDDKLTFAEPKQPRYAVEERWAVLALEKPNR
jgi:hypothetical protein